MKRARRPTDHALLARHRCRRRSASDTSASAAATTTTTTMADGAADDDAVRGGASHAQSSSGGGGDWQRLGALCSLSLQERGKQTTWTLVGQCVSGLRSCILVPELGLAFDFGFQFDQAMSQASVVCVSHGHADHIGALHFIALDRRMHRLAPPTFVMPAPIADAFCDAFRAYGRLNDHPAPGKDQYLASAYRLAAVDDDTVVTLDKGGGSCVVRAFKTAHGVPSAAFCVYQCSNKLLDAYVGTDGRRIGELRRAGVAVTRRVETPIVAYTGDSTIDGIVCHADLLRARVLIMECTYVDVGAAADGGGNGGGDDDDDDNDDAAAAAAEAYDGPDTPDEARKRKHVHERHIIERAAAFGNVQHLVLCHFSRRYRRAQIKAAERRVQAALGANVRVHAFVP